MNAIIKLADKLIGSIKYALLGIAVMFLIFNPAVYASTTQFNFQPSQAGGVFSSSSFPPTEIEFDNMTQASGGDWFACVLHSDVTCHSLWKKIVCLVASALPVLISIAIIVREAIIKASKDGLKKGLNSLKNLDDMTITINYWGDKSVTITIPLSAIANYLTQNPIGVIITTFLTISITEIVGRMCRCALCV